MKPRIYFSAILAAALTGSAYAETIDIEQARENATAFLYQASANSQSRRLAPAQSQMQHVYTVNTADGRPALYVFSTGDQGYIIASANDEAMTILGYSTEGTFDPENIPDGMRYLFDIFAEEIGSIEAVSASARKAPRKAETTMPYTVQETDPIEPLLETRWGQLQPYNRYCPFMMEAQDNGSASATGCMTTAIAQIMRYHKWPQRGQGSAYMEVKRGVTYDPTTIKYYEHTYNWDVMYAHRDLYPYTMSSDGKRRIYSTGQESVHNVSQLMFDLGVALRTEYGPSSSSTNVTILPALLSYFDYDPSLQLVNRSSLSSYEDWNAIVIEELQAKRPVYFEGVTNDRSSGHAFVCDGYDGKGFFHINWGWDGMSNDYFLTTALDPATQGVGGGNSGFSNGLALLRNMKPNTSGVPFNPYLICADRKPIAGRPGYMPAWGIWVDSGEGRELALIEEYEIGSGTNTFCANFDTGPNMHVHGKLGMYIAKPDGSTEVVWYNNGENVQVLNGVGFNNKFRINIKESWKQDGTRAFYVYQPLGKDEIRYLFNDDNKICSFRFEERDSKMYAVIDRTEVGGGSIEGNVTDADQKQPVFDISFEYTKDAPRPTERMIGSIGMQVVGGETTTIPVDGSKMYRNMTDEAIFTVPAGATIKPIVSMSKGDWMHGYFYIDYEGDGELSCNPNQLSQEGTDVASYSFWSGDVNNGQSGQNSAGNSLTENARNTLDMPAFQAPTKAGRYNVRFKIDWNCVDPAGNTTSNNSIIQNGGAIVDAVLVVTGGTTPTPEEAALAAAREAYTKAVADYDSFKAIYSVHTNAEVRAVATRLASDLATVLLLGGDATAEEYNDAASTIGTKVTAALAEIAEILANAGGTTGDDGTVFAISFDKDAEVSNTSRRIASFGLTVDGAQPQTFLVEGNKMYRDLTKSVEFTVPAGSTVTPSLAMAANGTWMHGYFYIDLDKNGVLSFKGNERDQKGTEVMSYSFWSGNVASENSGYNSADLAISGDARNTLAMPSFTAPATAGRYNVRFKLDWNCIDPAGNEGYMVGTELKNTITSNSGGIIDAVLVVTETTPTPDAALAAARAVYNDAVSSYHALCTEYSTTDNEEVRVLIAALGTQLGTDLLLPDGTTADEYTAAAARISEEVAKAHTAIEEILNRVAPDASNNAQLASIYAGAGTSSLQLYPEFNPDVHVYLARRGADDYDAAGSCYISPYYSYTITGTAEDSEATVSEPVITVLKSGWNRVTITCTAADKKTTEQYHIILLSSSGATGQVKTEPISVTDLSLMLRMMQSDFGYTAIMPNGDKFPNFVNLEQFNKLVDLLLKK